MCPRFEWMQRKAAKGAQSLQCAQQWSGCQKKLKGAPVETNIDERLVTHRFIADCDQDVLPSSLCNHTGRTVRDLCRKECTGRNAQSRKGIGDANQSLMCQKF